MEFPIKSGSKLLRQELASFADYVSEQSWRMRSDLGRDQLSKPQPSSAGALPRPPVEATAMSGLVDGGFSGSIYLIITSRAIRIRVIRGLYI
jgi:hypothetical protein